MPTYTKAYELLEPGETALCLFTNGQFFTIEGDTGSTGFWTLPDPDRRFDRVIICQWTKRDGHIHRDVFTALAGNLEHVTQGKFAGRYNVGLIELRLAGTTAAEWESFVDETGHHDKTRPVYVTRH